MIKNRTYEQKTPFSKKIKQRMKELIHLLEKWNYEYYVLNQPSIKDAIYDKNFKELQALETQYNFIFPNSPTQKAGFRIEKKFFPVKHQIPMLSLESTDNYEELEKFDQRVKKPLGTNEIEYLCELKIDGLSTSLHYKQGKLKKIITRGDGRFGEDVSINLSLIQGLPKTLPSFTKLKDIIEIRGEVYMKKTEFQRLNKELKKKNLSPLANPRNAAAGTLRTLNPTQPRSLYFFAYQILGVKEVNNQLNCLKKLSQWGFSVNPCYHLCQNIVEIQKYFQEIQIQRDSLDYEIDGIVVKVNNYDYHQKLGQTSRFPRWALAYKFPASIALSQVEDIQIEITRSGRVSYVAQITPIELLGSRINKSTLHNYGFIRNLSLDIGDQVVIKKAGDVIPQVIQVIKPKNGQKSNTCWNPPTNCPACFSHLEWVNSKESQEQTYQFCPNEECPERNIKSLALFASKPGMNIKGVSEAIIRKLYQVNLLKTPVDFYYLEQKKSELLKLEGFKKKSVDNLLNSIEASKKRSFASLLTALGIPLLGKVKSQKLISLYDDLEHFIWAIEQEDLNLVEKNLGPETQKALGDFFYQIKNKEILKELTRIMKK